MLAGCPTPDSLGFFSFRRLSAISFPIRPDGPGPRPAMGGHCGNEKAREGKETIGPKIRPTATLAGGYAETGLYRAFAICVLEPFPAFGDRLETCFGQAEEGAQGPICELDETGVLGVWKIIPVAVQLRELDIDVGDPIEERVLI